MGKIFAIFVIFLFAANTCFALGLELSEIIKEAREAEKLKVSQNTIENNSIQHVKNNSTEMKDFEQSACEKINTKEILESQK